MDKTLTCDCGFIARAPDDVGLATEVRGHAWDVHGMPLSHDEALLLLFHDSSHRTYEAASTSGQAGGNRTATAVFG